MLKLLASSTSIPDVGISQQYNPATKFDISKLSVSYLITGGGFNIITFIFSIIGFVFLFNIIMSGWDYLTSNGDPKKISSATSRFLNGFMGLVIVFFAFIIVNIFTKMIGLDKLI